VKFLIAGLGNIGDEYAHTRHNIGFDILDALAKASNISFTTDRYASAAEMRHKGKIFILIKPSTYMNLSGNAVRYWLQKEKLSVENLLVVVDDLALPFGTIRIRQNGSDAGHNGLKHINETLNTQDYPRLRFGIGNNFSKGKQIDFVLSKWDQEEIKLIPERIIIACDAVKSFGTIGIERTMNFFNTSK